MRFCPICENILIPKNKALYCKVCEKNFMFNPNTDDYTVVKVINHDREEISPIILRDGAKSFKVSSQIRKAYEDFF